MAWVYKILFASHGTILFLILFFPNAYAGACKSKVLPISLNPETVKQLQKEEKEEKCEEENRKVHKRSNSQTAIKIFEDKDIPESGSGTEKKRIIHIRNQHLPQSPGKENEGPGKMKLPAISRGNPSQERNPFIILPSLTDPTIQSALNPNAIPQLSPQQNSLKDPFSNKLKSFQKNRPTFLNTSFSQTSPGEEYPKTPVRFKESLSPKSILVTPEGNTQIKPTRTFSFGLSGNSPSPSGNQLKTPSPGTQKKKVMMLDNPYDSNKAMEEVREFNKGLATMSVASSPNVSNPQLKDERLLLSIKYLKEMKAIEESSEGLKKYPEFKDLIHLLEIKNIEELKAYKDLIDQMNLESFEGFKAQKILKNLKTFHDSYPKIPSSPKHSRSDTNLLLDMEREKEREAQMPMPPLLPNAVSCPDLSTLSPLGKEKEEDLRKLFREIKSSQ